MDAGRCYVVKLKLKLMLMIMLRMVLMQMPRRNALWVAGTRALARLGLGMFGVFVLCSFLCTHCAMAEDPRWKLQ